MKKIEEYIQNFRWDTVKFQMDKSLKVIGAKIFSILKNCDNNR